MVVVCWNISVTLQQLEITDLNEIRFDTVTVIQLFLERNSVMCYPQEGFNMCVYYQTVKDSTNPIIPDPAAAWDNFGAGWWWLVGDFSVAMATTIWEESTYFDHTFTICPGNVEREIHACVVPYRRSEHSTQDDRERERNQFISLSPRLVCLHWQLNIMTTTMQKTWKLFPFNNCIFQMLKA